MSVKNFIGAFQSNHVSHSFEQYVQFDGDDHVLVDLGDAYPRSVVLNKETETGYSQKELFKISGEIGDNYTGVSIGGFEISSQNYIVAINSIDQSVKSNYDWMNPQLESRDIILCVLPRNFTESTSVKQVTIKKYIGTGKIGSIPWLVKISDKEMMLVWQEFNMSGQIQDLKYVYINENGDPICDIQSIQNYRLSRSAPQVFNEKVVWSINENGIRSF